MISGADAVGIIGVSLSIYGYGRAQWRLDFVKRVPYSVLNLSSAVLLGVSLLHDWNLASFICNTTWGLISLYGLIRALRPYRRKHKRYAVDGRIHLTRSPRARQASPE